MAPRVTAQYRQHKRSEILAAADRVFLRLGFQQATMEDVMAETGMSRGGVYRYFANKTELYRAVVEEQDSVSLARLQAMASGSDPVGPALVTLFARQASNAADEGRRGLALLEFRLAHRADPRVMAFLKARFQRYLEAIAQVLQAGVQRGELTLVTTPEDTARYLLGLHDGLAAGFMAEPGGAEPVDEVARMAELMVRHTLGLRDRDV